MNGIESVKKNSQSEGRFEVKKSNDGKRDYRPPTETERIPSQVMGDCERDADKSKKRKCFS
jgi:hypothetical protein